MSTPEWIQYKPTTVKTYFIQSESRYSYDPYTTKTISAPDVPRPVSRKVTTGDIIRGGTRYTKPTTVVGIADLSGVDRNTTSKYGSIDRTAYFEAGKYPVYGAVPEISSREQFVSEGGVFGEPVVSEGGGEAVTEEGLFDEAKGLGDYLEIILIVGGIFLLFLIGALM